MTSQLDLCNRALAMAGTRSQITDLVSSPEGVYCNLLYAEFRDFLLRQGDYDFSLGFVAAVATAPISGWAYAYEYPAFCVRIRQLLPLIITPFDPQPIQWNIYIGTTIVTTLPAESIIYTANNVAEDNWDPIFTDGFVRLLASGLFFALENRIEAHKEALQEALEFVQIGAVVNP
jgi:hypothetical protein